MEKLSSDGVIRMTRRPKKIGNEYQYIITQDCSAWTAFHTLEGVKRFLRDYGLTPKLISKSEGKWHSKYHHFELRGKFQEQCLFNKEMFDSIQGAEESFRLSNGSYTKFKIIRTWRCTTLMYLNPNVKDREEIDYRIHGGE